MTELMIIADDFTGALTRGFISRREGSNQSDCQPGP